MNGRNSGFLTFLGLVALTDGKLTPEEKNMLDTARKQLLPTLSHDTLMAATDTLASMILHRGQICFEGHCSGSVVKI